MSAEFDPYYKWFGIPPKDQPPNHYRLLGIELFESDEEVIDAAANRQMAYLQDIVDGDHVDLSQRLLNEISAARLCLLSPQKKAVYDRQLRSKAAPTSRESSKRSKKPSVVKQPSGQSVASRFQSRKRTSQIKPKWIIAGAIGVVIVVIATISISFFGSSNEISVNKQQTSETVLDKTTPSVQNAATASERKTDDQSGGDDVATNATRTTSAEHVALKPVVENGTLVQPPTSDQSTEQVEKSDAIASNGDQQSGAATRASAEAADTNAGLVLWLDAADENTLELNEQNQVVGWKDQSGSEKQASAFSLGKLPTVVRAENSNLAVVRFSGGQSLSVSDPEKFNFGKTYSIVFVARGNQGILMTKGIGYQGKGFSFWKSLGNFRTNNKYLRADDRQPEAFKVRTIVADEQSLQWFVGDRATKIHKAAHVVDNDGPLLLGCRDKSDTPHFFVGDLAELLIYDRAINKVERETLYAYLNDKWLSTSDQLAFASNKAIEPVVNAVAAKTTDVPDKTEPQPEHAKRFVVLTPIDAAASQETTLDLLDEGRILAKGNTKRSETYQINFSLSFVQATAFRIEALPDESLPARGPGRGPSGRFSLNEVEFAHADGDQQTKITVARAMSIASGKVEQIIDGDKSSHWGIRRGGEAKTITLILKEPLELSKDAVVSLILHNRENLGCFRLLATSAAKPEELTDGVEDSAATNGLALHVNFGGSQFKDENGVTWATSKTYDDESWGHEKGGKVMHKDDPNPLTSTALRGIRAFRATVPDGQYEVYLLFCEHWTSTPEGRMFAVLVEGQRAGALNLLKDSGGRGKPFELPLRTVSVNDGRLDIEFEPLTDKASAILNAITIRQKR